MLKLDSIKTLAVLGMYCLQIQKLHTYSPGTLLKLGAHLLEWSIDNVSVFGGWNIPLSLSPYRHLTPQQWLISPVFFRLHIYSRKLMHRLNESHIKTYEFESFL